MRPLALAILVAGFAAGLAGFGAGCGGSSGDDMPEAPMAPPMPPVAVDLAAPPPAQLSAYHLFTWSAATGCAFSSRVGAYDINTALFSDYALKQRAIYIPEGAAATFDPE